MNSAMSLVCVLSAFLLCITWVTAAPALEDSLSPEDLDQIAFLEEGLQKRGGVMRNALVRFGKRGGTMRNALVRFGRGGNLRNALVRFGKRLSFDDSNGGALDSVPRPRFG